MKTATWIRRQAGIAALALAACLLAAACSRPSPEQAVAAVINDMARQVEKRDAAGLVAHLADDYRDAEGRDRAATRAMAEEYFRRYRGIKTKVLSSRVTLAGDETAAVESDVALYSGVGAALRKAVGFSGENYRVSCRLRRQPGWRVTGARWQSVPLQGLFPESLEILRAMFPELASLP